MVAGIQVQFCPEAKLKRLLDALANELVHMHPNLILIDLNRIFHYTSHRGSLMSLVGVELTTQILPSRSCPNKLRIYQDVIARWAAHDNSLAKLLSGDMSWLSPIFTANRCSTRYESVRQKADHMTTKGQILDKEQLDAITFATPDHGRTVPCIIAV